MTDKYTQLQDCLDKSLNIAYNCLKNNKHWKKLVSKTVDKTKARYQT